MSKPQAVSSDDVARQAAEDLLIGGGTAVGAVLAGFFAAAGAYAGVLLGPVSIVAGGVGAGARAFDGRPRQPGHGTKRPRGFKSGEEVPEAARVAIPAGVQAALVAHAYDGARGLGSILRAGIAAAQRSGADARADLLRRIREVGAGALSEPSFVRALLRIAGPSQGGLVTSADFRALTDLDVAAADSGGLVEPPWSVDVVDPERLAALGYCVAVCAVDARGAVAALCFHRAPSGIMIDELDLEAPALAVPVRRAQARIAPGEQLPAPAPIALALEATGAAAAALADPRALRLDRNAASLRVGATA